MKRLALLALVLLPGLALCSPQPGTGGKYIFDLTISKGGDQSVSGTGQFLGRACIGYAGGKETGSATPLISGRMHFGCYPFTSMPNFCRFDLSIDWASAVGDSYDFPIYVNDLTEWWNQACSQLLLLNPPARIDWTLEIKGMSGDCQNVRFSNGRQTLDISVQPRGRHSLAPEGQLHVELTDDGKNCEVVVTAKRSDAFGEYYIPKSNEGHFILGRVMTSQFCPTCRVPDIPYLLYKVAEPKGVSYEVANSAIEKASRVVGLLNRWCIDGACPPGKPQTVLHSLARRYLNSAESLKDAGQEENAIMYATQAETIARRGIYYICLQIGMTDACLSGGGKI